MEILKSQIKTFGENEIVYHEGMGATEAYRIVRGGVELSVSAGGRKVVTGTLGAGDTFGEMSLIQGRPREVTVRTLMPTDLEVLQADLFIEHLRSDAEILIRYLDKVYERVRATSERLRVEMVREAGDAEAARKELGDFGSNASVVENSGFRLVFHNLANFPEGLTVAKFPFFIGRETAEGNAGADGYNDQYLFLRDASPHNLSSNHCVIEVFDGACFIRDCSSQRGTLVNGLSIGDSAREMTARLKPGHNNIILGDASSQHRLQIEVIELGQSA